MSQKRIIIVWLEMLAALAALLGGSALVRYAHGQVVNDRTKAAQNSIWLQKQFDSGNTVTLPKGVLFINKAAKTRINIGTRITTKGSGIGYWYPADHPSKLSDSQSRIHQLTPGEPCLILRGTGVICYSPLVLEGEGKGYAIVAEGRGGPVATGHHKFQNIGFYNWDCCALALNGYYKDDGTIQPDENHADNSSFSDCYAFNCNKLFESRNQQALNWKFEDWFWQGTVTPTSPAIAFDIQRGGSLTVKHLIVENPRWSMLRLKDFSPNNCWFKFEDIWVDTMMTADTNFCWVEYVGDSASAAWSRYHIVLDVFTGTQQKPIEQHQQFKVPANLPRDDWNINIHHVVQGK